MLIQFQNQANSSTNKLRERIREIIYELIGSISRGIKGEVTSTDPIASLKREGEGLCVTTQAREQNFDKWVDIFPELCRKHNVSCLPGNDAVASRRSPAPNLIKYEFNISINDFHKILMAESDVYRGYRHGNSLIRLKNPDLELIKEGKICLFPALELVDNKVMLRFAGCNTSEIISTQLAFLLRKYFSDVSGEIYGHHSSPLVDNLLAIDAAAMFEVIQYYFKIYSYELCLKEQDARNEEKKLYIEIKDGSLHYVVRNYQIREKYPNKIIEGKIEARDLSFSLSEPLTFEEIQQHLGEILKITTERGHTRWVYDEISHQTEAGFRIVLLTQKTRSSLVDMSLEAFTIYNALGPVLTQELQNLKSVEVPVIDFLVELKAVQKRKVQRGFVKSSEEWFKKLDPEQQQEMYHEHLQFVSRLTLSMERIDALMKKISADLSVSSAPSLSIPPVLPELTTDSSSQYILHRRVRYQENMERALPYAINTRNTVRELGHFTDEHHCRKSCRLAAKSK